VGNEERIRENLSEIRGRIARAAERSGRLESAIRLVAVTKKSPVEWIRPLVAAGACDLGENYPQELWSKAEALDDLAETIRWHLIGHLQSNKVKKTLPMVRLVHSVDSLKLLRVIHETASGMSDPPGVCLQVNTSEEESKHGWSPEGILADAEAIGACGSVPILGLMTIAGWGTDDETARPCFVNLRELRDRLSERIGRPLPELSMGMSNDFEAAIEEGATLVRIGSALFEGVGT
jgi:PLP dependent protein